MQRYDDDAVVVLFDEVGYKTLALEVVRGAGSLPRRPRRPASGPAPSSREIAAGRLGDRRHDALRRAARQQLGGLAHDADRADRVARVVGDRRATLDSPSTASSRSRATPCSRTASSSASRAFAVSVRWVSLGSGSASSSATTGSGAKASIALPSALACAGSCAPTSSTWKAASGRKTWWTTVTEAPCRTPTRTARPVRVRKPLGVHERARAQLVEVEVGVAEVQQPRAELVLVRVAVLLDEAVRRERLQQAVHGRPREPELVGELAHAEPPRTAPERLQDARRAVDRLDRPAPSWMSR